MLRIALKNLWAYKRRLLTSALSVVLGISFLSGSFVFTDTLKGLFVDLFASATKGVDADVRAVQGIKQSQTENNNAYDAGRSPLSADLVNKVREVPGVAAAESSISGYAQLINKKGKLVRTGGAPTFGYLWVNDTDLSPYRLLTGRAPKAAGEIVIDRGLAKTTGYNVGDTVQVNTLEGAKPFRVVGQATFGSSDSALGSTGIFFEPTEGQELLLKSGQVQDILVKAVLGVTQDALAKSITAALKSEKAVNGQPIEAITGVALEKENVSFVNQIFGFINTFFNAFAVVALFVSIFVISNSFSIVVAQRTKEMALLRIVGARRSQVMGSTFLEALTVGVIASFIGVLAGLVVALGIRALLNSFGGGGLPSAGLVLKPRTILVGMVVGTFVTVLSSVLPSWKSSRVKPLAALRDIAVDHGGNSRPRLISGLVALAGSLFFLVAGLADWNLGKLNLGFFTIELDGATNIGVAAGLALIAVTLVGPVVAKPVASGLGRQWFGWIIVVFGGLVTLSGVGGAIAGVAKSPVLAVAALFNVLIGVYLVRTGLASRTTAGHIARENAIRNPTRTSVTALALTIGTALVSALLVLSQSLTGTFRGALDTTVKADYVVTSAADIGFPEEVKDALEKVPGVQATSGLRFSRVRFGFPARRRTLGAVDPQNFEKLVDLGDVQGDFGKLAQPNRVAIDRKSAADNDYKIGDTIRPQFANGARPTLTIVAFYENAEGLNNTYYLTSIDTLKRYEASEADSFLYVKSDGKDKAAFEKATDAALKPYPAAELKTKKKFADETVGQLNQFLAIVNALLLLAIIIAILGIANTLKLSIFERTREIGLLRAVGMSRDQVRSMIRWEAIVVATLGSVIGVVLGTGFGSALVKVLGKDGALKLTLPYPFIVIITLLASIVGLYAARKPAKDAARMNILEAIATE